MGTIGGASFGTAVTGIRTDSSSIWVGLVGCGNIGDRGHAAAYAAIPGVRVVAVADVDPSRAEATARRSGAEVLTFDQMIHSAQIDIIDIALPTFEHAAHAIAALEAGKHVVCEKPMAATVHEADAMVAAAEDAGRKLMTGHVRRFDARFLDIKEVLAAGEIGVPRYIRRAERQWLPFGTDSWHWHPERGGGVALDLGAHVADLVRWLFAQDPDSVYARSRAVRSEAKETNSPDYVVASFRFPDGSIGDVEVSWAHPPAFSTLYGWLDVVGTSGKVQLNDHDGSPMLRVGHSDGPTLPSFFDFASTQREAFRAELEHFVDCVVGDRPPAISTIDARAAVAMAVAMRESARRVAVVDTEEFGL